MGFVVDASVIAAWLLPDETSPIADAVTERLVSEDAFAPAIWWFEIRNILLIAERRGRITARDTEEALSLLSELRIGPLEDADETAILDLARGHGLTVYDAAYLELARRTSLPLATLDRALATAAGAEKVTLVGPGLPS